MGSSGTLSQDDDSLCSVSTGSHRSGGSDGTCSDGSEHGLGSKRAAAALAVGVGSFSDPEDLQGLSHYLEHMLFMGSEEFPGENEYDDFLAKHAGSSNAFTEMEHTNFHFEVEAGALLPALSRFAAFFKHPLCKVNAVDSEFTGVCQDDQCRMLGMLAHTAPHGHPLHRFSWGNRKSLWDAPRTAGIDIRERIMAHHAAYYSARHMRLVILGGEELDVMAEWAAELFAPVANRGPDPPSVKPHGLPFSEPRLYLAPAIHEGHHLSLTFQLPSLFERYGAKAEETVSHLLGHEGPGSLFTALRARKWATELCSGVEDDGHARNQGYFLLQLDITLTEAGLTAGEGLGLAVVDLALQYVSMLRAQGPQEWVWKENAGISQTRFRFKQEQDSMETVTQLASDMLIYRPEDTLAGGYLYEMWDPALVKSVLNLLSPCAPGFRIDLQTSAYDAALTKLQQLRQGACEVAVEPWFGMPYASVALQPAQLAAWEHSDTNSAEFHLPPRNPFIPDRLDVLPNAPPNWLHEPAAALTLPKDTASLPPCTMLAPERILDVPGLRVWHRLVTAYNAPRAVASFRLAAPALSTGTAARAAALLLADAWNEQLTEAGYQADLAGLSSHVAFEGPAGLEASVAGFDCKLTDFAVHMFQTLGAFTAIANWEGLKEARIRRCKNAMLEVSKHANWLRLQLLLSHNCAMSDLVAALQATELRDVLVLRDAVLAECHVEVLAEGNMTSERARVMATRVWQSLSCSEPVRAEDRVQQVCVGLPLDKPLRITTAAQNADERNSVVQLYLQLGEFSVGLRTVQLLLEQVLNEPIYNVLRTQQQLGYSVSSCATWTENMLGFHITVVSELEPRDVEAAIEKFLEDGVRMLEDMPVDDFAHHVSSLVALKSEACNNIVEQGDEHWAPIWRQTYNFYERFQVVNELVSVDKEELQKAYAQHIAPGGEQRRKLVVAVHSQVSKDGALNGLTVLPSEVSVKIDDIEHVRLQLLAGGLV